MSLLTNEEKLYVLYTKGHFEKYKDAKQIILSEFYGLNPECITAHISENFMIDLYIKLASIQAISMDYENSIGWLLNQFRDIGSRPLASKSLHDWLYNKIAHALPENLDLDNVNRQIETTMTLKQEWIVATDCPYYKSPVFEIEHDAVLECEAMKKKESFNFIPILKSNEFKNNWVYAEPYAFVWSSTSYESIYKVIAAAEDMYPGDFLIGQRTLDDVINIKRSRKSTL